MSNFQKDKIFLGLMSGTSLDGLDMAFCSFQKNDSGYSFKILYSETIEYENNITSLLKNAHQLNGCELVNADRFYGYYLGKEIKKIVEKTKIVPDYIASHGHTIFHNPKQKYTFQLGHGPSIAAECGFPVIYDFRSLDVALGGQGAPLVPIGDKYLFSEYLACVNLGGFSNVSFEKEGKRVAFDICPVNFVANILAQRENIPYDKNGEIGKQGSIIDNLLTKLLNLDYHKSLPPKSLGREWVELNFTLFLNFEEYSTKDLLRTLYEYIAIQIVKDIPFNKGKILFTGGGAKNLYLMQLIQNKASWEVVIPDNQIIDYKESLIFAFMAFLKIEGKNNCLKDVTGASRDCITGSLI